MERREFLKLVATGLGVVAGSTACGRAIVRSIDTPAAFDPEYYYLKYYADQGLNFREYAWVTPQRSITVMNATDMSFDEYNFQRLYDYFQQFTEEPFEYHLTETSGSAQIYVTDNMPWQKNGQIFVVPRRSGLPPDINDRFSEPPMAVTVHPGSEGVFTTFIRVPDENEMPIVAPSGDVDRQLYVQISASIEACQAIAYVNQQSYFPNLVQPPVLDQRHLAQEGFCNTYGDVIRSLLKHEDYSADVFYKARPFLGSDGNTYAVKDAFLTPEQYYFFPSAPYLKSP